MAKIDILLPFWGDVGLFKLTVQSVLSQTEKDWHLIVLDDHYPSQEPEAFLKSLKDSRITYIRHPKNIGITRNFNAGLEAATARYITIIGCDDIMLPSYVEIGLTTIGSADMYQPAVEVIDAKGVVFNPLGDRIKRLLRPKKAGVYSGQNLAASLCRGNWLYFPSIIWKTDTVRTYGFNNEYKIVEDVELELNILKDNGSIYVDNAVTFQYRRFAESLSSREKSKHGVRFNEEAEVYNKFAEVFRQIGWNKASHAARNRLTSRVHQLLSR
jgi:glycosyltransferase involved in cell wall biosynthesis